MEESLSSVPLLRHSSTGNMNIFLHEGTKHIDQLIRDCSSLIGGLEVSSSRPQNPIVLKLGRESIVALVVLPGPNLDSSALIEETGKQMVKTKKEMNILLLGMQKAGMPQVPYYLYFTRYPNIWK